MHKDIPSAGPQHIYMSLYFVVIIVDAIVVFGINRMDHAMCIQTTLNSPVSVQVWGAY